MVQVSEFGRLADQTAFLVMELLAGVTLRQRMRELGGPLPLDLALGIGIQLTDALDAGHQRGVIHRDLKPDNIMLVPDPAATGGERIKLLDYGIAKLSRPQQRCRRRRRPFRSPHRRSSLRRSGHRAPRSCCRRRHQTGGGDAKEPLAACFLERPLRSPRYGFWMGTILLPAPPSDRRWRRERAAGGVLLGTTAQVSSLRFLDGN